MLFYGSALRGLVFLRSRRPANSKLKNTHPGCFGMPKVSRSTVRVQSSYCMSGNDEPQSHCASAEPDGRPDETMHANLRRRWADEPAPACGDAPVPGLREWLPDHSIAWGSNRRSEKAKSGGPR